MKKSNSMPKINWNDAQMKTAYANVCNVLSTQEEVTMLFGTRQTWHAEKKQLDVKLSDRIILNPIAAKRLLLVMKRMLNEYESRYGELDALDIEGQKK